MGSFYEGEQFDGRLFASAHIKRKIRGISSEIAPETQANQMQITALTRFSIHRVKPHLHVILSHEAIRRPAVQKHVVVHHLHAM